MTTHPREYQQAITVLMDLLVKGKTLDTSLDRHDATPLVRHVCYGVAREYFVLEAILGELMDKPLAKKHADIRMLLLAGIYSIRHLHRPDYATVDRVVEATRGQGKSWAKGLVNGVLRNFIRRREALEDKIRWQPEADTNHPQWLLDRLRAAWPDHLDAIIAANNSHPPMTLRVNRSQISVGDYARLLDDVGIECEGGSLSADALTLAEPVPVSELPGFSEGLVSVQDEASQLAAPLLDLFEDARVLDACAAPGGKTCHILETQQGVELTAMDLDASRSRQIADGLSRLHLECTVLTQDLLELTPEPGSFDRILLDVPCSATGIIRRHPDIKLLRRDTDIDKLSASQLALLERAWQLLGEDGILLYSTCSILPDENDAVVSTFVNERNDARVLGIDLPRGIATSMGRQLLPETRGYDGFYYSKLKKVRSD